ncbi:MAG TPA: GNAT family N-acetyltransferase, partial [Pyrinomonadaceae bacterium]|nr:GNAT family N-acetyltransferase [Pyrinomonadaceae bacterium]
MSNKGLRFASAASVPLYEYAALFTASFGGYQYQIAMDAERLARRVRQEQHDLTHSLVAYAGAKPVGIAALAVRGQRGWVGGFGVVPDERGRGRGREMMSALLEQARACRLRTLSLEVLAGNTAARRLYERAGMLVARDLLILERPG